MPFNSQGVTAIDSNHASHDYTEDFWQFATSVYRKPGVASLCLHLQDTLNADVVLLLFACWHGGTRGDCPQPVFNQALDLSRQWCSHVVHPLRAVRQWMKVEHEELENPEDTAQFEMLRQQIKDAELEAEHWQINRLEAVAISSSVPLSAEAQRQCMLANLQYYLQTLPDHDSLPDSLEPLIQASVQLLVPTP